MLRPNYLLIDLLTPFGNGPNVKMSVFSKYDFQ